MKQEFPEIQQASRVMALFADDKRTLQYWRAAIMDYLASLRLVIHTERAQPRPVEAGIPFLGFVVYPDYRRVKRRKVVAYHRRLKALQTAYQAGQIETTRVVASLQGWLAHIRHGNTWALAEQMLLPIRFSGGQV